MGPAFGPKAVRGILTTAAQAKSRHAKFVLRCALAFWDWMAQLIRMIRMTGIRRSPAFAVGVSSKLTALKRAWECWRSVRTAIFDRYRPELHYMRGPGPKYRKKQFGCEKTGNHLNAATAS
jgi:hypothetical protein